MKIEPSDACCGAIVRGIDLRTLDDAGLHALRQAWLTHKVIGIEGQDLTLEELEAFGRRWGPFGADPYLGTLPGHPHLVEVKREPDEKAPVFAGNWHSDWSFLAEPPAATLLYGRIVPPVGGDTLFADLQAAFEALPEARQRELEALTAIHSASRSYAPDGRYGERDVGRSMNIRSDESARATQTHGLVRRHPETGQRTLFLSPAYTIGLAGIGDDEAREILEPLFSHCGDSRFVYRHRWTPGMLTIWDNRCLNHMATGGYDGHRRQMVRMTVGEQRTESATA